jgi:hypothetical protein
MAGLQRAQEAEMAELRERSEVVLRRWYEEKVLSYGGWIANVESRIETAERQVRRTEKLSRAEAEGGV